MINNVNYVVFGVVNWGSSSRSKLPRLRLKLNSWSFTGIRYDTQVTPLLSFILYLQVEIGLLGSKISVISKEDSSTGTGTDCKPVIQVVLIPPLGCPGVALEKGVSADQVDAVVAPEAVLPV